MLVLVKGILFKRKLSAVSAGVDLILTNGEWDFFFDKAIVFCSELLFVLVLHVNVSV